jgi:D-sedoheptulose 7-phosphate isomerase
MSHLAELAKLARKSDKDCDKSIRAAAEYIASAFASGNKLLVVGNGGSAADAQHFAAEFVGRYMTERRPFPAIGLSADMSIVTAVGNDYGFEYIFARQIEALGDANDVLVLISTSGLSQNLLEAARTAYKHGLKVITLTGRTADPLLAKADVWCHIDSDHTAHIQEVQIAILHAICEEVERLMGVAA